MEKLMSRWGRNLNKNNVHQEYPRPQMVRNSFFCLNGNWEYAVRQSKVNIQDESVEYDGDILVPFPPESQLSGVQRIVQPEDYLYYKKIFRTPNELDTGKRILLHFGAVDQECEVYLNGIHIGGHKGGYLPFYFDVTYAIADVNSGGSGEADNILVLEVRDFTEKSPHARGKQRLKRDGVMSSIFYTPSSGIWKSVWMEIVPQQYIEKVVITPDFDNSAVEIKVNVNEQCKMPEIEISYQGIMELYNNKADIFQNKELPNSTTYIFREKLKDVHGWTPEHPNLYDVTVKLGEDRIESYFGMRKLSKEKNSDGKWIFCLNNEPIFFNGVLDQGYWPESLMTPPTDKALEYDIVKLKNLGFNTIRKHIKVESERFYYHCDRLGMIVWQDMVNGGDKYNMLFNAYLPNGLEFTQRIIKDSHYLLFNRKDVSGRSQYYDDLQGMIEMLYSHPCIAVWTAFNEGWGQFDTKKATDLIRSLDKGRLVNEACGWFDQGGGDIYSIHNYLHKLKMPLKAERVIALTEFGGYAYPVSGHMACDKKFGYKGYKSKEELSEGFRQLYERDIYPNIENGLCAAIYTQTCDIEEEINGFMTYDREVDKFDEETVKEVNDKLIKIVKEVNRK